MGRMLGCRGRARAGWRPGDQVLVDLQRRNTHLDDGVIVIDPLIGAMIESTRGIALGPPKTAESARTITLPPFLIRLLRADLTRHDHPHVFTSHRGEPHRRSNFGRRALRPAKGPLMVNSWIRARRGCLLGGLERGVTGGVEEVEGSPGAGDRV